MAFICEVICSYIGLLVLLLIMISTTPLLLSYNVLSVQVHYIQLRTPCQVVPVGFHYKTINRSMEGFGCGGLSVSNGFVSAGTVFCSGFICSMIDFLTVAVSSCCFHFVLLINFPLFLSLLKYPAFPAFSAHMPSHASRQVSLLRKCGISDCRLTSSPSHAPPPSPILPGSPAV